MKRAPTGIAVLATLLVSVPPGSAQCVLDKLLAEDKQSHADLGYSVAVDGDYAIAGAWLDDAKGNDSGAAYVFERAGKLWKQVAKLAPDQIDQLDAFGGAVSIRGDVAVVGAFQEQDGQKTNVGAAYFFERKPSGIWEQTFRVQGSNATSEDRFGQAVVLTSAGGLEYALIGAPRAGVGGLVYVFQRVGTQWFEQQQLSPPSLPAGSRFGLSLAADVGRVVAGAPEQPTAGSLAGACHVLEYDAPSGQFLWSAALQAADVSTGDELGHDVAVLGDLVLAGAHKDDPKGTNSGSAYLFSHGSGAWQQIAKFVAADGKGSDRLGAAVELAPGRALLGAPGHGPSAPKPGEVYVYSTAAGYAELGRIAPFDGDDLDDFGAALSRSGDLVMTGTPKDDDQGNRSGSAYVHSLSGSTCTTLIGLPRTISASFGGVQLLYTLAGNQHAGDFYLVLGSVTGSSPGIPISGLTLPLVWDPYLVHTLGNPNLGPLYGSLSNLDAAGEALTLFILTGSYPQFVGVQVFHATAVLSPTTGELLLASDPTSFTFVP